MNNDLISRQAAIDALNDVNCFDWVEVRWETIREIIEKIPPARPEPLTDNEQRIFLAAMEREYNVCKKVDEEYYDINNISLVRICREIERKVKSALWTKS